MLKQSQSQKLVQKILPQIIQRQSLLQISTLSIEQMIRQELELNPFLEEVEELEEATEDEEKPEVEDEAKEKEDEPVSKQDEEFDVEDYTLDETEGFKTADYDSAHTEYNYDNMWKSKVSINDNLLSQLHLSDLTDKQIFIGEVVIGYIDEEGYIRDSNADILADVEKQKETGEYSDEVFTVDDVEAVIKLIHKFDPIGIGARSLNECLIVQIEEANIDSNFKNLCIRALSEFFEEFRLKSYEKLIKELNVDADTVNHIFEFVTKLNPKPGISIDASDSLYIYPDLIIFKDEDTNEWTVELNDRNVPPLRLNKAYRKLTETNLGKKDKDAKEFIKNNFERAKWFIEAIKSRRETMLKVMNSILKRQIEFFETNGENFKPMYEKDVAEDISMDISTVSRTVRGKYVQTTFGIFELKSFFSNYIRNDEGDDISTKQIKEKIKEIISRENPQKPLTDDDLTDDLNRYGFKIARRTVAKYREALNIPKARLRRKITNDTEESI
ncbi:RNA polymerase sigma-54 factor [bacterium]|nr:MAG: RNA polymerase sigma-54 factor [bacterium]